MSKYWQDKVVIVTGSSRGLGRAIAKTFAAQGAKIVIAARDSDELASCAMELRAEGADLHTVSADVTNDAQVALMIEQTLDRYGRIEVLVNNAGRCTRSEIATTTPADFRELLEVNLLSVVRCTHAALPQLLQHGGHVVNIGSLASKTAARYLGGYSASKFAVAAYSQALRLELGPQGLHVLLVGPGPILGRSRYDQLSAGLPEQAKLPAPSAKLAKIDPRLAGSQNRQELRAPPARNRRPQPRPMVVRSNAVVPAARRLAA